MNTKFNWEPLITGLDEIVPVIGDDLSIIQLTKQEIEEYDGLKEISQPKLSTKKFFRVNLYKYFAIRLAKTFKVTPDPGEPCLSCTVMKILEKRHDVTEWEIKRSIKRLYNDLRDDQLYLEPFEKLAQISDIKTYITVNFDDFIERAFRSINPNDTEVYNCFNFSLPLGEKKGGINRKPFRPSIFNIAGSINHGFFSITDEHFLEYVYVLKEKGEDEAIFRELFEAIKDKSFLLIGCSFPNWLMRFFIRIISNEPFSMRQISKTVADDGTLHDPALKSFLEYYRVRVVNVSTAKFSNAIDFVYNLYDAWSGNQRREVIYKEEIFLSFASDDRPIVSLIAREFENRGVKVFLDSIGLNPGDKYDPKIKDSIKHCDYFIPFLSKKSISDPNRYVNQNEWLFAHARRIMNEENSETSFIKPYIIDDTDPSDPAIPYDFNELTIGRVENTTDSIREMVEIFIANNRFTKI